MNQRITKASANCLAVIKHFEELRLSAYLCPAGVWTIGYGSTRYPDGSRVKKGDRITRENAEKLLNTTIVRYERDVDDFTRDDITQNEFDALVSFSFNVGSHAYKNSSLRKDVNRRMATPEEIRMRFGQWTKAQVDGRLVSLPGLVRRRKCEAHLYLTGEVRFFEKESF